MQYICQTRCDCVTVTVTKNPKRVERNQQTSLWSQVHGIMRMEGAVCNARFDNLTHNVTKLHVTGKVSLVTHSSSLSYQASIHPHL